MRSDRPVLVMAVVLFYATIASSLGAQPDRLDDYITAEMAKRRIPGLALAVVQRGEVVKMSGYGLANLELDVPVTPDTVFELASVTKQFTATAIMLLIEEGKVGLHDPISQYLPNAPAAWKGISVRHLLTHTAGLPSLETGFRALRAGGARTEYTTVQMFEAATQNPLSFMPGERWQYSDVGYFLLGMTATSVLDQWAVLKNRASGYTLRDGQLVHIRRVAKVGAPG